MFTIPSNKIDFLKENGLYDYLIDMEGSGKISQDDKEEIYQYILADSLLYMSQTE